MGKTKGKKQRKQQQKKSLKDLFKKEKDQNKLSLDSKSADTRFSIWLKPFLQLVAIIVSCFAAYFAYKSYSNTLPEQIELVYWDSDKNYAFSDNGIFLVLDQLYDSCIVLGATHGSDIWNSGVLLPIIKNSSKKSIKNFNLKIEVNYSPFSFSEEEIDQDFIMTKHDTTYHTAFFEYKYDALYANSKISSPLDALTLHNASAFEEDLCMLIFNYSITYDGVPAPIQYTVHLYTYYNDTSKDTFKYSPDDAIGSFLDEIHDVINDGCDLISICESDMPRKTINPIDINKANDEFEKAKSDIIKSFRE